MEQPKSVLEGLRDFFSACPLLENGKIRLECLGPSAGGYSLESTPADPVYKQYASGDYLGQLLFVLASREEYGPEDRLAITSCGFYVVRLTTRQLPDSPPGSGETVLLSFARRAF